MKLSSDIAFVCFFFPEFRATREKHDFFTICRTPELACEVTLQVGDACMEKYTGFANLVFFSRNRPVHDVICLHEDATTKGNQCVPHCIV